MAAIEGGLAFFIPPMATAAFAALKLLTQFGNLLELVGAPTGGRAFVRAPPPLICPGPGGLGGFVPHVGNVLVLAVVLRPGTGQVSASGCALCGPQLDTMTGDQQENGEAGGGAGGRAGRGRIHQTTQQSRTRRDVLSEGHNDIYRTGSRRAACRAPARVSLLKDAKRDSGDKKQATSGISS